MERSSFSFFEFYIRRINRIFPALLVVLIACFTFGWFVLLADEYKQLGKHIAGGAGFISNFVLWSESGYFDNASETKPLLHLWSLGIEEQFYIVWPLLLWFSWKKRLNLLKFTIVIALISFALNIREVNIGHTEAAFYSPQSRFWELLMGTVLAFLTLYKQKYLFSFKPMFCKWLGPIVYTHAPDKIHNTLRDIQSLFGATIITLGIFYITKENAFPGYWAVLPTAGAFLIISAGKQAWINRIILSNRVLVWFGLISFPLYLWHWPLLSFARIMQGGTSNYDARIVAILLSILLAWLTYRLIEIPFRFSKYAKSKTIMLVVFMIVVGFVGYISFKQGGLAFRLGERQEFSEYFDNIAPEYKYSKQQKISEKTREECNFNDGASGKQHIDNSCYQKNPAFNKILLIWGDSHGQQLNFGLKINLPPNWQILQIATSACTPTLVTDEESLINYCNYSNWFALKTIKETKPDTVIVAQNEGHNIGDINKITASLKGLGIKKIIFTGPVPHWGACLNKIIARDLWINTPRKTQRGLVLRNVAENTLIQEKFRQSNSVIYANIMNLLCDKDGCLTYIGNDKTTGLTTYDSAHLSPSASDYVAKNLLVRLVVDNNK